MRPAWRSRSTASSAGDGTPLTTVADEPLADAACCGFENTSNTSPLLDDAALVHHGDLGGEASG